VLINRPELPPAGAGESSIRPVAAAIANAVFDATGVPLRRADRRADTAILECRGFASEIISCSPFWWPNRDWDEPVCRDSRRGRGRRRNLQGADGTQPG
jgi:hypothetical protein